MNAKLQLLQRKMDRQAPAPAPEVHGIGAAIEQLIADEVERRVGEAVERKPPAHVQRLLDQQFKRQETYTSFEQIPPTPKTRAPKAVETQLMRNELGQVNRITVGTMEFFVQRNELGQVVRMVPADTAPLPPAVPPAKANKGT
ncbi:hypothetical protein ACF8EF_01395 [Pseudomonas sp. zjy_15]|uniref:hypothetical protein n=1 Tax=Pseudomonas sp. zjy_15 TaxID=3367265 RepID=UPI00370AF0C1